MPSASTNPAEVRRPDGPDLGTLHDDRAVSLITALKALAPDDPARPRLREETITAWLPMARRLTRRYAHHGEARDDLVQVATVGLIKAVDRFDAAQGAEFTSYAIPTILGELKRHFRDKTWAVRVPRRLQEMRMAITRAGNDLVQTLGRSPTVSEIAAHLGATEEEVIEGLEGSRAYRCASLSTPAGPDDQFELGDSLGAEDGDYALTELRLSLKPAMAFLSERQRMIVTAYFYGNQTQAQIAVRLGVSQMQVSRLLAAALGELRARLGPDAH
jgi:RNA polymerase sigma-B factor